MLDSLSWLTLEVNYLDPAVEFYRIHLDFPVRERTETEARLGAMETDFVLRTPSDVPRGGLHIYCAFSIAGEEPFRVLEIIAPEEFFAEVAPLTPLDPTDEAAVAEFLAVGKRYGFEADLESVPKRCAEHDFRM